jgi:hypothetical protein
LSHLRHQASKAVAFCPGVAYSAGMTTFETVDDAAWFLHAAGWSASEARVLYANGDRRWLVTASADGHEVRCEEETQTEAWRAAAEAVAEQVEW